MNKRRILCFGDSNTHGTNPVGPRYGEDERWPALLQAMLGEDYRVLEEGFGGRTIAFDDPVEGGYKSAMDYLPPCLMSHDPLDMVIVMLGTNDVKQRFAMSAPAIAQALAHLLRLVRLYAADERGEPSRVLAVAPPPVRMEVLKTRMAGTFDARSVEVSEHLAEEYLRIARLMRCEYINAADFCRASDEDGVHLTAAGHRALARGIAEKIREIFKEE